VRRFTAAFFCFSFLCRRFLLLFFFNWNATFYPHLGVIRIEKRKEKQKKAAVKRRTPNSKQPLPPTWRKNRNCFQVLRPN
jgi:hypothetical protein